MLISGFSFREPVYLVEYIPAIDDYEVCVCVHFDSSQTERRRFDSLIVLIKPKSVSFFLFHINVPYHFRL